MIDRASTPEWWTPEDLREQTPSERRLGRALHREQQSMDPLDGMAVFVQPWVLTRSGRWFRPDFVCSSRSLVAVEVDGASHRGRYAADRSRDHLLRDAGVPVLRVPAEDLDDRISTDAWTRRIAMSVRVPRLGPAA